jgi:hypothetical protein
MFVSDDTSGGLFLRNVDGDVSARLRGTGDSYVTDGDFGIGTDDPDALLHVKGTGDAFGNHVAIISNESTDGTGDGLLIVLGDEVTSKQNNFITFLNGASTNRVNGRIEGFDLEAGDWQPPPVTFDVDFDINFSAGSLPTASFDPGSLPSLETDLPFDITFNPGSLPSLTFSGGSLPSIGDDPFTFDLPTQGQMTAMFAWANVNGMMGFLTLDPVSLATTSLKVAAIQASRDGGVTYGSKGADYAEWMPKLDPEARFQLGQVVGVYGGKISLETEGADSVMATSHAPVVVGNIPPDGKESEYEKIAFMGQAKVVVRGRVAAGDYIVPSGLEDGTGVAVAPTDLTIEHLDQILGRAWSDSTNDIYTLINVSVGLDHHAPSIILRNQQATLNERASENAALRTEVDELRASIEAIERRLDGDSR